MGETGKESCNSTVEEMNEIAEGYAEFVGEVEFCLYCGTAIGIKGDWVQEWEQLSLWSQSELDQI